MPSGSSACFYYLRITPSNGGIEAWRAMNAPGQADAMFAGQRAAQRQHQFRRVAARKKAWARAVFSGVVRVGEDLTQVAVASVARNRRWAARMRQGFDISHRCRGSHYRHLRPR